MSKKVPIIRGKLPDNEYDLDNKSDLLKLGLHFNASQKIADTYVHYRNCQYAIVEFKSSTLRKALDQLETTVKRLMSIGKRIDFPIIVTHRLSSWEKRIFKRGKDKILRDPRTGNPYLIKSGSKTWCILLFYDTEVDKMYNGLNKYFGRKQSNWEST